MKAEAFHDQSTRVEQLKMLVKDFVNERNWWSYHTPKNLAASVSIEAAELLELFQWTTEEEGRNLSPKKLGEIREEMADVLAYLLSLANVLQIDVAKALQEKMEKNGKKYPAHRFQGTWEKVSENP